MHIPSVASMPQKIQELRPMYWERGAHIRGPVARPTIAALI
jgi:hypothetical protein